jgi:hypothetical protein
VEWQGAYKRRVASQFRQLLGNDRHMLEKKLLPAKCAKESQRSRRKQDRDWSLPERIHLNRR